MGANARFGLPWGERGEVQVVRFFREELAIGGFGVILRCWLKPAVKDGGKLLNKNISPQLA